MNTISLPKTLPESHKLIVVYSTKLATSETKLATSETKLATSEIKLATSEIKLQSQLEELKIKEEENQQLKEEVKLLRKLKFAHKSEKWTKQDKKQALLFNEAEAQTEPLGASQQQDDSEDTITVTYTRKKNAERKKLDPNLSRKEIVHDLSEIEKTCQCGNTMQQIGKDEREELDMEPAKYWVNHHIYPQYTCSHCTNQIDESTSEVNSAPIEKLGYDQILSLRQKKSQLIVEELKEFLYSLHVPPKSLLGKAVSYNLNQWEKLLVFLDNPFVPIDNNRIENDIRPFVLGRKNWLFSGSPRGAHASCMIYSLIRTAEANGLKPYQYLRYLLEQLVHLRDENKEEIAKLTPHQIDPSVLG